MTQPRRKAAPNVLNLLKDYMRVEVNGQMIELKKPKMEAHKKIVDFVDKDKKSKAKADDLTFFSKLCAKAVAECVEGITEADASVLAAMAGGLQGELVEKSFGLLGLGDYYQSVASSFSSIKEEASAEAKKQASDAKEELDARPS